MAVASQKVAERLESLIEPEAARNGYELVAVEQAGGRGVPVIRVLLDREGGVDLEALTTANRWISKLLDDDPSLVGPYTLEVSSPGVDRPLRRPRDFQRFVGETATVKSLSAGKRTSLTGRIATADDVAVTIDHDGEVHRFDYKDITKARLKGVVDFGTERGAKNR